MSEQEAQTTQLAEVIPFPSVANEMAVQFAGFAADALAGRITGYVTAFIDADGAIHTQYSNVDLAERTVLAQHLQFDVIDSYIDEKLSEVFE